MCDLKQVLRIPQAKTSRHLGYLKRAGLVLVCEEGLWSYYSLAPAGEPLHRKLLDCLAACSESVREIEGDKRRALVLKRGGGCCPP